ncbi:hypothetical protein [Ekhidna sp. To15]|uniref:hypothetical protein n=1 Tax=Ekhidna sp. To15 TaxID=3395267 RepID=UPI003F51C8FA
MKSIRFILWVSLIAGSNIVYSQNWVGLSIGGNQTFINFQDAAGQKNDALKGVPGFTASSHFQFPLSKIKNLSLNGSTVLNIEGGYKSTKIVDINSSQQSSWTLRQLTSSMTIRKHLKSRSTLIPFYEMGGSVDYMLSGTQTLGFEQYDLDESLNTINISIQSGLGLQYEISYDANATILLGYLHGLSDIEKDQAQKAKLNGLRISIAIYFTIEKSKKH